MASDASGICDHIMTLSMTLILLLLVALQHLVVINSFANGRLGVYSGRARGTAVASFSNPRVGIPDNVRMLPFMPCCFYALYNTICLVPLS